MFPSNTTSKLVFAALLATLAVPANATEAGPGESYERGPRVMVPSPTPMPFPTPAPAANDIAGCWSADRNLYGYKLSFCVRYNGRASYTITGNGVYCHARLGMEENWGSYSFTMSRASCGWGMDWSADTFACVLRADWSDGPMGRVPVPSQGSRLDCRYVPAVGGYRPKYFSAHRA